jgi:hypothetical protein
MQDLARNQWGKHRRVCLIDIYRVNRPHDTTMTRGRCGEASTLERTDLRRTIFMEAPHKGEARLKRCSEKGCPDGGLFHRKPTRESVGASLGWSHI